MSAMAAVAAAAVSGTGRSLSQSVSQSQNYCAAAINIGHFNERRDLMEARG